jgi:hypothetical protein
VFKPPAVPPAQPGTPVVTNGALPFTGLQLSLVVVIGFELLAIGTLVRRIGALLR